MKDFSTVLLVQILRTIVDHVEQSPEFDQASPGLKDFKRTLLEQTVRLQASDPRPATLAVREQREAA